MNNLLPALAHGFNDEKLVEKSKALRTWLPTRADPADEKNIPFGLEAAMTKEDGRGIRYSNGVPLPSADPNHRDIVHDLYSTTDPSPLSASERGEVIGAPHIAMPKNAISLLNSSASVATRRSARDKENDDPLSLHITNLQNDPMEIYIQRASSVRMSVLRPNMCCLRTLSDTKNIKRPEAKAVADATNVPFSVLFASVSQISTTITGRHEVKTFEFSPGPIVMEVEVMYNRIICSRVVPDSQASKYEDELVAAEVLSVNGTRVQTLDDFQGAILTALSVGEINIGVAAYRKNLGGRKDFAHFIGATKNEFKSLLSNMMKSGIDKDHQHGIVGANQNKIHSDSESSESSDDEESSVMSKSSGLLTARAEDKDLKLAGGSDNQNLTTEDVNSDAENESHSDPSENSGDSDDHKAVSIRKTQNTARRAYGGMDSDNEKGMIIVERRARDEDDDQLYRDDEDFFIQVEEKDEPVQLDMNNYQEQQVEESDDQPLAIVENPKAAEEKDEPPAWDYATALDVEESIPFSVIICVPPVFRCSSGWGAPTKCVQFTNYSVKWDVQICWIDEESAIVPRTRLRAGQKHVEMTSPKHLWILIATSTTKHGKNFDQESDNHDHHLNSSVVGTAMIIRPSNVSLRTRKYTSAMWIPTFSLTTTQRLRAKVPPAHKLRADQKMGEFKMLTNLSISIMDGHQ